MSRILVIVPTHQEAGNIEFILRRVRAAVPDADVLVIDDASTDGTPDIAATIADELRGIHVLRRPGKDGLGNAYRIGFAHGLKEGKSEVVCDLGTLYKVSKDKNGIVTRDVLTKNWTDWIDYWSVDFDFENKREIIRIARDPALAEPQRVLPGLEPPQMNLGEYEEVWTGDYIFENEWQSFRTKKDRTLELKSVFQELMPGRRKVAVKVVDIFGNDTMTIVEVMVGGNK